MCNVKQILSLDHLSVSVVKYLPGLKDTSIHHKMLTGKDARCVVVMWKRYHEQQTSWRQRPVTSVKFSLLSVNSSALRISWEKINTSLSLSTFIQFGKFASSSLNQVLKWVHFNDHVFVSPKWNENNTTEDVTERHICNKGYDCFINKNIWMLTLALMASLIIRCLHCPFWSHSFSLFLHIAAAARNSTQSKLVEMPRATAYDKAATTRSY